MESEGVAEYLKHGILKH